MVRALSGPAPLRLRPLEIGDLLDETFRIYRRHFLLFAGISVVVSLPQAALSGYSYFALLGKFLQQSTVGGTVDFGQLESSLVVILFGFVVNLALIPFYYGAVTFAACESAVGRAVTVPGVGRAILGRYFPLLGFFLLIGLMGVLFCLIPLWIWIWVGWVAVMPIMFVENIGLGAAMGRSRRLVEGRWWRTFLILFLMGIVIYFVNAALTAFLALGQSVLGIVAAPLIVLALASATQVIVQSLVNPVFQIAVVLIYLDLRVRREALDLFQLAQRVPPAPLPS